MAVDRALRRAWAQQRRQCGTKAWGARIVSSCGCLGITLVARGSAVPSPKPKQSLGDEKSDRTDGWIEVDSSVAGRHVARAVREATGMRHG
jgi:hypothetical protein